MPHAYIVECSDGSYYVGSTWDLDRRLGEHNLGLGAEYTKRRRPVRLVWAAEFNRIDEAYAFEKQVQGWGRAKRQALIEGRIADLPALARTARPRDEEVTVVSTGSTDGGMVTTGSTDGGVVSTGSTDGGVVSTGSTDEEVTVVSTGSTDGGMVSTGSTDGGVVSTGSTDGGVVSTSSTDGGVVSTGSTDGGMVTTSSTDGAA